MTVTTPEGIRIKTTKDRFGETVDVTEGLGSAAERTLHTVYPRGNAMCVRDTGVSAKLGDQSCPIRRVVRPLVRSA